MSMYEAIFEDRNIEYKAVTIIHEQNKKLVNEKAIDLLIISKLSEENKKLVAENFKLKEQLSDISKQKNNDIEKFEDPILFLESKCTTRVPDGNYLAIIKNRYITKKGLCYKIVIHNDKIIERFIEIQGIDLESIQVSKRQLEDLCRQLKINYREDE